MIKSHSERQRLARGDSINRIVDYLEIQIRKWDHILINEAVTQEELDNAEFAIELLQDVIKQATGRYLFLRG